MSTGNEKDKHVAYNETGSFSLSGFNWREVRVKSNPCLPSKKASDLSNSLRASTRAGGFSYRESSSVFSRTRNRFIIWHYTEGRLKLVELSLDIELADNAVELVLESPDLVPDVGIHEGRAEVVVLFATTSNAYRLVLPHPTCIHKTPSRDEKVPSVLAFVSEDNFIGLNVAPLSNQHNFVPVVTCCVSCVNCDGLATFAFASPSGAIIILQLQKHGLPVRAVLQESSVMSKLLSNFLPGMSGHLGAGVSDVAPTSLLAHVFNDLPVVIALCTDLNLRVWSVQLSKCVMSHDLSQYLHQADDDDSDLKVEPLALRAASDSAPVVLRFAVHFGSSFTSQISIFKMMLVENQLHMLLLHTCFCQEDDTLLDFIISESELWGLWLSREMEGEGDQVLIKQAIYNGPETTEWREVCLASFPSRELLVLPHQEPREFYLTAIFHPGRFSTHAILKALELYKDTDPRRHTPSLLDLPKEVTLRVEHELQVSAGSLKVDVDLYRQLSLKCWAKFYLCCLEYQQLASKPLALFRDARTGMGIIVKQGVLTFLRPINLVECLYTDVSLQVEDPALMEDTRKFVSCTKKTLCQLSPDILESFFFELGCYGSADINPPIVLAGDLAQVIHDEEWDEDLCQEFCSLTDLNAIIDNLLVALDPLKESVSEDVAEEMEEDDDGAGSSMLLKHVQQIFGGKVSMAVLSSAFQESCRYRLCLCRNVLITLLMLRQREESELLSYTANTHYQTQFSRLIQRYYSLYWLATHTHTASPLTHDDNLRQLADLNISGINQTRHGSAPPSDRTFHSPSSLPFLYLSTHGHQVIVSELVKGNTFPQGNPNTALWIACFPAMLDILIKAFWPVEKANEVATFLLDNAQHCHLQTYVETLVGSHNLPCDHTLHYLLGKSLIRTGEMEKAFSCFSHASHGITSQGNPMLQHLVDWHTVEGKMSEEKRSGKKEDCLARYYEMVMRVFEQVPSPRYVIRVAQEATRLLRNSAPTSTIFWSVLFKYHLEFGDGQEAYKAMMAIPDPTLRIDCLRRLVIVLTEQNRIRELCEFKYTGLEREVEELMETRARSVDVMKHCYYDLLYCYHTSKNNLRKTAYVMYEYGLRLGREGNGPQVLHRQANCYSMAILSLSLVDPKYAWVLRPVQEVMPPDPNRSRRKRVRPGRRKEVPMVEVLTISDIDKDYNLVRAKFRLFQKDPTLATQLSSKNRFPMIHTRLFITCNAL